MAKLDLIKKERTVYGYDILKAASVAFRMAEDRGKPGNAFDITESILMALMDDDLYENLHKKAKENHEKALGVTEALDKIMNALKELSNE